MLFTSRLTAQDPTVLERNISGTYTNAPLREILEDIEAQVEVEISYSSRKIPVDQTISISFSSLSIHQVFSELQYQVPMNYEIVDGYIVLTKGELRTHKDDAKPELNSCTLNGFIKDRNTGEFLIGATVYVRELELGTITNSYGYFSITLPVGKYSLNLSYIGYQDVELPIDLISNTKIDFRMNQRIEKMEEVVITSVREEEKLFRMQAAQSEIQPAEVTRTPSIMGESDVIKALEFQPGITFNGDGSSYFHVRGGYFDQNLILLDEATIYNPSHMLGIFSPIIPDAVKTVDVYKADFPVNYGGRLSSVVDIRTRDGNKQKWGFSGSMGIISLRGTVEGPLKKDAHSIFVSFRRSYFDSWLKKNNANLEDLYFYDFTTKLNFKLGSRDRIFLTLYKGEDIFKNKSRSQISGLNWGNTSATLRWSHIFGSRVFLNSTLFGSRYDYYLHSDFTRNIFWNSRIGNFSLKEELNFYITPQLQWKFGFKAGFYDFNPGNYYHPEKPVVYRVSPVKSTEIVLYAGAEHEILNWLRIAYGLRMTSWANYGEAFVFDYDENFQPTALHEYDEGETFFRHGGFQPRVSVSARTGKLSVIKAGYSRTAQYINLITNSISPFNSLEVWLPAGPNIKPQYADILDLGFVKTFERQGLTLQTDVFYKWMYNQIGYEYHANMLINPLIEGEIRQGKSWSYGLEASVSKKGKRVNGIVSYTFSRTFSKIDALNGGRVFPAIQDRPHVLNLTFNYTLRPRWLLAFNYSLSSGARFTSPVSFYYYQGYQVPVYTSQNNDQLPVYRRLDFSSTWQLNRNSAKFRHSLSLAVFNLGGRENPIFINFNKTLDEDGNLIVPSDRLGDQNLTSSMRYTFKILPSVSYQFSF